MAAKKNSKQLPVFEGINDYLQAKQEQQERAQQLSAAAKEVKTELAKLQNDYSKVMQDAVREGKDATAELDKLSDQIEEAEKKAARKQREAATFNQIAGQMVDKAQVKTDFAEYTEKYEGDHMQPALEAVEKVKAAYIEAAKHADAVKKHHEAQVNNTVIALGYTGYGNWTEVKNLRGINQPEKERIYLTEREVERLNGGL